MRLSLGEIVFCYNAFHKYHWIFCIIAVECPTPTTKVQQSKEFSNFYAYSILHASLVISVY